MGLSAARRALLLPLLVLAALLALAPAALAQSPTTTSTEVSDQEIALGESFYATATVTGTDPENPPTGEVYFYFFPAEDGECGSGAIRSAELRPVSQGDGSTTYEAESPPYEPYLRGTWKVAAQYQGYGNNSDSLDDPCEGPTPDQETYVVGLTPIIETALAPSTVEAGEYVNASAELTAPEGEPTPTGVMSFYLYGPGDTDCSGPAISLAEAEEIYESEWEDEETGEYVFQNAAFTSLLAAEPGTLRMVTVYSGDGRYEPVTSPCGGTGREVVATAPTVHSLVYNAEFDLGGSFQDRAWLYSPDGPLTGTFTFDVYGPDDEDCSGPVVDSSTVTAEDYEGWIIEDDGYQGLAPGTYGAMSKAFTPTLGGTYRVIARYDGDEENDPISGACNDPGESVLVNAAKAAYSPTSLTFASLEAPQAVGTIGPSKTFTITNEGTGGAELVIRGFVLGGDHPEDFIVSSDTCREPLRMAESCTVNVRFTPQGTGERTATLRLASNDPANTTVALTGIAGPAGAGTPGDDGDDGADGEDGADGQDGPAGTDGTDGTDGAKGTSGGPGTSGPVGPAGPTGANGLSPLASCARIRVNRKQRIVCSVTSEIVRLSGARVRVRLRKGGRTYASGTRRAMRGQRALQLVPSRKVRAGRYRLTIITDRKGRETVTTMVVRVS